LRIGGVVLLVDSLLVPALAAESEFGLFASPCVPEKPSAFTGLLDICDSAKLSLKIDAQQPIAWPIKESMRIDVLDVTAAHRVVVACSGKPQQSFRFRFSNFKTTHLCLFINDLYKTVQLWEPKKAPWCHCE
jgi:hypothetical protein